MRSIDRTAYLALMLPVAVALAWGAGTAAFGVGEKGHRGPGYRIEAPRPDPWRDGDNLDAGPVGRWTRQIPHSDNVRVLGNVALCAVNTCGDVWGRNGLAIVAKRGSGWGLVDTGNPSQPREIASVTDDLFVQDVKVSESGTLAVVSNENDEIGAGAILYDVSNPFAPRELSRITHPGARSVHNVFLAGGFLYLASNSSSRIEIYDVRSPRNPVRVASVGDPNGRIHDMAVVDGILYGSFLRGGFTVHDVADPRVPLQLASHDYAGAFTHNAWPSADGRYLFTTDEVQPDGHMRVWDLGEAGGDSGPVRQVGRFATSEPAVIHNVHTLGNLVYIAYYSAGLRIVDVSEPRLPVEVAYADTSAQTGPGFVGAWGVFPFTGQSHVYVSDMQAGLWAVRFTGEIAPSPGGFGVEAVDDRGALVARRVFRVRWDPHPQAAGYRVYRSDDSGVMMPLTTLGATDTTFVETGPAGAVQSYAVTAVLPDGTESRPTPILIAGVTL